MESGTGSLAFSPIALNGYLAAGGWDGELLIWDLEVRSAFKFACGIADGQSGEKVKEWEVEEAPGEQSRRSRPLMVSRIRMSIGLVLMSR